ncbi:tetratricopeptide repeat protein [Spirillospora sp. CA-142024]|uniref:tetratricopeptide repeat protein n=1 Tax=Spirillospora sp. CA-142024 TaxID=3240036 RepID=UPI003D93EC85
MPRWGKVSIATVLPLAAGALAWWVCAVIGVDPDASGIVVGLVVLVPGTPLVIWAGQAEASPAPRSRPVPAVIGDVPREPRAFQPRPDLLASIEAVFRDGGAATVCALVGARGVGKTQIAAAYARDCAARGVPVAWLHAETEGQLTVSLHLMAAELGLRGAADDSTAVVRKLRAWLEDRDQPYLVVLDNADDPDMPAFLLPARGGARVLITTNDMAFERIAAPLPVARFTAAEARRYLRDRVGGSGDEDPAGELIEELDRLPLALSIAAAALVGPPRVGYGSYLARVRRTPVDVLLDRPRGEPYPRGVGQAITLALDGVGPPARRLLGELAVLSASGVSLEILGPEADGALAGLGAVSLVAFTRDGSTALVHRLVRRVVRDGAVRDGVLLPLIESAALRLRFVERIAEEDTGRRLPTILAVDEHATALWEPLEPLLDQNAEQARAVAETLLKVRHATAEHLLYLNDGARAIPVAQAVVDGWEKVMGPDHCKTLDATYTLAHAYEFAGLAAEAVDLFGDLVARRARILGEGAPETLRAQAGLASALTTAGRADEAVLLLETVVAAQSRTLSTDHSDLLASRFFLAYALVETGQPDRAAELFETLVSDQVRLLGADHPETLVVQGRLAWAYRHAGRADETVALYEHVLPRQERVIGADHPDTLITVHGLAFAYEAAGRTAEALAHYERAADRLEAVLGPDQPWTLTAARDLARARRLAASG